MVWVAGLVGWRARGRPPLLERTRCVLRPSREGRRHQMLTGSVKKIVAERGFGFIAADDGQEYFFHRSGIDSSLDFERLAGGERVTFDVERSDKGPRASQVRAA